MTIKEIETLSGLPRANIRYYESEGLIAPKRAENGYREYSQADAEVLLRVKLLRALPWYLVLQAAGVDPKARLTSIWLSILGMVTMLVLEPLLLPTKRLPPPRGSCWTSRCRSFTHRRLSDRLFPHHNRLHRPCRRRLTGASAKYDRKLYAVLRYAEAGWVTHRPCSQMSKRIQICCGFSQKILLPPGGTGTLPIAAGFPWFFA